MKYLKFQKIFIVLFFVLGFSYLISQIPWNSVFSDTNIDGGDMVSHNYVAYYAQKIFPKIKWWSPDWFAGFPFLYFYPPLLFYITAFLSHFIYLNVAFKLVTLLGTLLIPLAVFLCLSLLKFKFPIPSLGALLSLSFLFSEGYFIYGANIPSTLAGEFSYSFSFAFFFVFIGLLIRGIKENRYLIPNILLLSIVTLSHPLPVGVAVIFAVIIFLWSVVKKEAKRVFLYLLKVFGFAFGLTAFWSLPFLGLLPYTLKISWDRAINLEEIFSPSLAVFEVIAIFGLIYAFSKKDKKVLPLIFLIGASLVPFLFLNHSSVLNARFLPFILMTVLMVAAYMLGSWAQYIKKPLVFVVLTIFGVYVLLWHIPSKVDVIPSWIRWNYEGMQTKDDWPEFEELWNYLKDIPYGRVMWENYSEHELILADIPIFADKPTFETVMMETSLSSHFHYINQLEVSETASAPVQDFDYPPFNFENGVKHLQYFGAQYFIAHTEKIKNLADQQLFKMSDIGKFGVYQISDSHLVEVIPDISLELKTKEWLDKSTNWYMQMDLSKPIVFYKNKKELGDIYKYARLDYKESTEDAVIEIKEIKDDSLTFSTDYLGIPHLIKYSYFPGWKVKGANGPYLVSPSFMMVVPFENEVTLEYSYNMWDKFGFSMSAISLGIILFWCCFSKKSLSSFIHKKYKLIRRRNKFENFLPR